MDIANRRARDCSCSPSIDLAPVEFPSLHPISTCAQSLFTLSVAVPRPRKHLPSIHTLRGNTPPPSARQPLGRCKYETAMSAYRRRMPYSLGADILPEEKEGLKERLEPEEEEKLTTDIMDLYDRLLPSAESDDRRRQLVQKLEKLFNEQWPGHEIKANIFGSSGNKLCSSDSDVDICITTNFKDLEQVCLLAAVLADHGMERVVCVSHAKVPIVKIWDPELRLACDMNVNNTLALENTRMIRTYVEVDDRVRPLAMCVKHWTKRRVLNDAGLGGTLSSYTWICLIINFLQTREPPILPSLQARPHNKRITPDGLLCSFDDNLDILTQFGRKNHQSVGELFFEFFRYYGHELDFEKNVISVREGKLINKDAKNWHLGMNNRLCVEEPFNTSRNLGNTADDTSFRGLHLELRRAFRSVAKGDMAECCEQFEFPQEEERTWERPPPQPRPTLTPSLPSRGGRGGNRGGRFGNQSSRGGLGGRRTSNTGNKTNFRQPNTGNMPDISLQAQQQAQYLLHDQLYQQIQLLQAQEQELRMQLHNQALITGRPPPVFIRQPFIQFPVPHQQDVGDESTQSRSGTASQSTLSPTQRQQTFYNPSYAAVGAAGTQGSTTNPPSPAAASALPDLGRNPRRGSVVNGSPKSIRAHSQPARPQNSPSLPNYIPVYTIPQPAEGWPKQRPAPESSEGGEGSGDEQAMRSNSLASNGSRSDSVDENRPQEVLSYYMTPQQLQAFQQGSMMSPMSTQMGLQIPNGYSYVPIQQEYRQGSFSSGTARSEQNSAPKPPSQPAKSPRPIVPGPLIVDGSVPPSETRSSYASDLIDPYSAISHYTSTSDDHNMNTPASFSDSLSQDYQDSGSFDDMEHSTVFTRPSIETQKVNGVNGERPSTNGRPEVLADRLQNYHLSAAKLSQQPAKTSPERPKNGTAQGTSKDSQPRNSGTGDKPATSGPNENRHQTTNSKRRTNGETSDKTNSVNGKAKPKGRHDASHNTAQGSKDRHTDHPPRKPGGQTNGTNETNHGGWQTTKKKNRKNTKSSSDSRHGINGGPEPLPADESLRKGG
ncbi:hypothetical protein N7522_007315 [Penicillium canescens]|uniref:uncharacterized protein n=1 Tax=Penicillium canescens TaxID=5083 RepID=UPI0026E05D3C|nr:uncharacterized protein N7446_009584 [Penicillium canescens]KAJ6002088.1 hypothetical protein N7522_007315 [Penicillium canescens]KAJ6046493.1 hypothetical protein N7444_007747 [Penicillium canescens]KAJ6053572.1 hypothetical protein N7446_009584 [Penicillium canescens]